jgi:hypothetical protein
VKNSREEKRIESQFRIEDLISSLRGVSYGDVSAMSNNSYWTSKTWVSIQDLITLLEK